MLKLIHFGDSHINENLNFEDTLKCLDQVTKWAWEYQPHFVIVAGNLFDRRNPTPKEYLFTSAWLSEISKHAFTIIIPGDRTHEQGASPNDITAIEPLRFVRQDLLDSIISSTAQIVKHEFKTTFFLLPTPYRSELLSREETRDLSTEEINALISQKLKEIIWGFKAQFQIDQFNILIAHLSVRGCAYSEQIDVGLSDIFLDPDDLDGFDFCCFGHLHTAQKIRSNAYYSGSLNRINFSEEKLQPHALLIELEKDQEPKVTELYTEATRYQTFSVEEILNTDLSKLNPETHYRVKGEIAQEDLHILRAKLKETPMSIKPAYTVKTISETRSETLSYDLGLERALDEYLSLHPEYKHLVSPLTKLTEQLSAELRQ